MILSITTREFKADLKQFISSIDDEKQNIIPIVMFDDNKGYHIEYVHVIKVGDNSIGISYKYEPQKKTIEPTSIHLDKEFIEEQHKLIYPDHDLECLDNFISCFDDLQIGDPNQTKNQLMQQKKRNEKLTQFIRNSMKYIKKIISNIANITIDNLQKWLEKAKNAMANKVVDFSKDLASLCSADDCLGNAALKQSAEYISRLEEINNFYFQQTLNPLKCPIIPHWIHQQ